MKKLLLSLTLFLFVYSFVLGQNNDGYLDSLLANKDDTSQAKVLYDLAFDKLLNTNPDSAEVLTLRILKLVPEVHRLRHKTYRLQGYIHSRKGENQEAILSFKKALFHARNFPLKIAKKIEGEELINIAGILSALTKYQEALSCLDSAEFIFKQINNTQRLALVISQKAEVYSRLRDYVASEKLYLEGIRFLENKKDTTILISVYQNYAWLLRVSLKRNTKALEYLNKAKIFAEIKNNDIALSLILNHIGIIYTNLEKYQKSAQAYKEAEIIAKKIGNKPTLLDTYSNRGEEYYKRNKLDSAVFFYQKAEFSIKEMNVEWRLVEIYNYYSQIWIKRNNYLTAINYANKSLKINQNNNKHHERLSYELLSQAYKTQKEYKKALHFHELYKSTSDSLLDEIKIKEIKDLEITFETEKKEAKIKEQALEAEVQTAELEVKNRTIFGGGLSFLVLALGAGGFYVQRQKRLKQEHEFNLLTKQNDLANEKLHEIASTLHTDTGGKMAIIVMMLKNKNVDNLLLEEIEALEEQRKAIRTVSYLIDLPSFEKSTIEDELKSIIVSYEKKLQELNLNFEMDFQSQLGWQNIAPKPQQVIYRIVQELLYNSIKHSQADEIKLKLKREPQNLISLTYTDNGIGYDPKKITKNKGYKNELTAKTFEIGGKFIDNSQIDKGVNVKFEFPLN